MHSKERPLHIPTYSQDVDKIVTHDELVKHLSYNVNQPNAIPYHEQLIYGKDWGFCVEHSKLENFKSKEYQSIKAYQDLEKNFRGGAVINEGDAQMEYKTLSDGLGEIIKNSKKGCVVLAYFLTWIYQQNQ